MEILSKYNELVRRDLLHLSVNRILSQRGSIDVDEASPIRTASGSMSRLVKEIAVN
jgi:hypothetical protein